VKIPPHIHIGDGMDLMSYKNYKKVERMLERILKFYPDWKPGHWTEILAYGKELGLTEENDPEKISETTKES